MSFGNAPPEAGRSFGVAQSRRRECLQRPHRSDRSTGERRSRPTSRVVLPPDVIACAHIDRAHVCTTSTTGERQQTTMHAVVQRLAANMAGAGNAAVASDVLSGEGALSTETTNAVNLWVGRIDGAFRKQELETAFAYARAGVHRHGAASEKLSKRWLCMSRVEWQNIHHRCRG